MRFNQPARSHHPQPTARIWSVSPHLVEPVPFGSTTPCALAQAPFFSKMVFIRLPLANWVVDVARGSDAHLALKFKLFVRYFKVN